MKRFSSARRFAGSPRAGARLRRTALGAGLAMAAGCHSYVPVELSTVPQGEVVRLAVTRAGSEEVARVMETDQLRPTVRGELVGRDDDVVLVRIPVRRAADPVAGGFRLDLGQIVRIPEGEVLAVDRQQFSTTKTLGLAAGTAAVVGFLLYQIFDVFRGSDGDGGPDPDLIRIPLTIPIG